MLKRIRIDGQWIACVNKREAKTVSKQVEDYFQNEIDLNPDSLVFDVGANIGLFSRYVLHHVETTAKIYAFEPIPLIFEALVENTRDFGNIRPFNFGLSDAKGHGNFLYFVNADPLTTMYDYGEPEEYLNPVLEAMENKESYLYKYRSIKMLPLGIIRPFIKRIISRVFKSQKVRAPLRTLSDFIEEHGIKRIDLLKIDVEKAELDVLNGITDDHLSMVRQLVMELHDIDGRKREIENRLRSNGFDRIIFEQDFSVPSVEEIFTLYALKKG